MTFNILNSLIVKSVISTDKGYGTSIFAFGIFNVSIKMSKMKTGHEYASTGLLARHFILLQESHTG